MKIGRYAFFLCLPHANDCNCVCHAHYHVHTNTSRTCRCSPGTILIRRWTLALNTYFTMSSTSDLNNVADELICSCKKDQHVAVTNRCEACDKVATLRYESSKVARWCKDHHAHADLVGTEFEPQVQAIPECSCGVAGCIVPISDCEHERQAIEKMPGYAGSTWEGKKWPSPV